MDSGTVENCTVEDGTKISASSSESYVGGIAGYANEAAMTGNTWPKSIYSAEVGSDYVVIIPEHKDTTRWNGHKYQIFSDFVSWEEAESPMRVTRRTFGHDNESGRAEFYSLNTDRISELLARRICR